MDIAFNRVALVGQMHAGKTTAAEYLISQGFQREAMAGEVKAQGLEALNFILEELYDLPPLSFDQVERDKELFRPFWQWYGTKFMRQYMGRPNNWIDCYRAMMEDYDEGLRYGMEEARIVCDDVRFHNEVDALREMGFYVIRITRNEEERIASVRAKMVEMGFAGAELEFELARKLEDDSEVEVPFLNVDFEAENTTIPALKATISAAVQGAFAPTPVGLPA